MDYPDKWRITPHALMRFRERIDDNLTDKEVYRQVKRAIKQPMHVLYAQYDEPRVLVNLPKGKAVMVLILSSKTIKTIWLANSIDILITEIRQLQWRGHILRKNKATR